MDEIWKTVPEASKYAVSNLGRVMNSTTGQILRQHTIGKTPVVNMQAAGRVLCRSVPKMVRELF